MYYIYIYGARKRSMWVFPWLFLQIVFFKNKTQMLRIVTSGYKAVKLWASPITADIYIFTNKEI